MLAQLDNTIDAAFDDDYFFPSLISAVLRLYILFQNCIPGK